MKISLLIVLTLAAGIATPSFAGSSSQPSNSRHRLADCMSREMAASRTLSYYAAEKLCTERLRAQEAFKAQRQEGLKAQNDKSSDSNPLKTVPGR